MMKCQFKYLHKDIWTHAIDEWPYECCGLIVKDKYVPLKNVHPINQKSNFKINKGIYFKALLTHGIQAVIHSHVNHSHLSSTDMIQQKAQGIPWGVAFIDHNGRRNGIHFWGEGVEKPDLIGRIFVHGLYDCYSLICDWYEKNFKKIQLPFVPRDYGWWGLEDLVNKHFKESGFIEIDKDSTLQPGDILFFKMEYDYLSHAMIYVGEDKLMHHPLKSLSSYLNVHHPFIRRVNNVYRNGGID